MEVEELSSQQGAASTEGISEPPASTVEESLKRLEGLLRDAKAYFNKARELEATAKAEEKRLADQKRDQEAALRQKKKDAEADIDAAKKAAEAEVVEKNRELAHAESTLLARIEGVDKREAMLTSREAAFRAKDADLVEGGARLAERELNAEQGFLAEKARILKPVEDEVKRLRMERDRLDAEIAAAREKAEDDIRAKAKARAEKWSQQDASRTEAEAEARRKVDETVARDRQEKLDALRALLAIERQKAEAGWQAELDRRLAALV
jgi:hypothetical protein